MKRTIVQVSAAACEQGLFVYAVSADGTAWRLDWVTRDHAVWEKLPDLPGDHGDES